MARTPSPVSAASSPGPSLAQVSQTPNPEEYLSRITSLDASGPPWLVGRQGLMHRVGLTRAGIISPTVAVLDRVRAPVEKLLARANIPAWARTDPEMLIRTSNVARLLAEGTRTQGIEN